MSSELYRALLDPANQTPERLAAIHKAKGILLKAGVVFFGFKN